MTYTTFMRRRMTLRIRQQLINDNSMKSILLPLISTNGGWLVRQGLKLIASGGASVTTYLLTLGVPENHALAIVAGLVTLVSAGFEFALSKLASKIAAPCIALACLMLCSCSSFTKQDARDAGESIGLAAADTAILIARMQLASANADLEAAKSAPGANASMILAKQMGVIAAQRALDAAQRAIEKQRARTSAKQPIDISPKAANTTN